MSGDLSRHGYEVLKNFQVVKCGILRALSIAPWLTCTAGNDEDIFQKWQKNLEAYNFECIGDTKVIYSSFDSSRRVLTALLMYHIPIFPFKETRSRILRF